MGLLAIYSAYQFLNGICAACAMFLFCFKLNNIERLFGLFIVQLYYGFLYTIMRAFPEIKIAATTWGAVAVAAVYIVISLLNRDDPEQTKTSEDGRNSGAPFIIGLSIVYYMIICMNDYIEWVENYLLSMPLGFGMICSVFFLIIIQVLRNYNALYIWLSFLAFSLFGLGIISLDSYIPSLIGSFIFGLGDGFGYIIIYYLCLGTIKQSRSLKMFRLFCLAHFIDYFLISGVYSRAFYYYTGSYHTLALIIVLVLCSFCFLMVPVMQKKLFQTDWTDGITIQELPNYKVPHAETEAKNKEKDLDLTEREQEILTLLISGKAPKEIAYTLKISYFTVTFHQRNLYRKLGIQSKAELFAWYYDAKEK